MDDASCARLASRKYDANTKEPKKRKRKEEEDKAQSEIKDLQDEVQFLKTEKEEPGSSQLKAEPKKEHKAEGKGGEQGRGGCRYRPGSASAAVEQGLAQKKAQQHKPRRFAARPRG